MIVVVMTILYSRIMRLDLLEMYIEISTLSAKVENPTLEQIQKNLKRYFDIDISIEELQSFYLPETQDRLAQMKSWGMNY